MNTFEFLITRERGPPEKVTKGDSSMFARILLSKVAASSWTSSRALGRRRSCGHSSGWMVSRGCWFSLTITTTRY